MMQMQDWIRFWWRRNDREFAERRVFYPRQHTQDWFAEHEAKNFPGGGTP